MKRIYSLLVLCSVGISIANAQDMNPQITISSTTSNSAGAQSSQTSLHVQIAHDPLGVAHDQGATQALRSLFIRHDGIVGVRAPKGWVIEARSSGDSAKVTKFTSADSTQILSVLSPDGGDFLIQAFYPPANPSESATKALNSATVAVKKATDALNKAAGVSSPPPSGPPDQSSTAPSADATAVANGGSAASGPLAFQLAVRVAKPEVVGGVALTGVGLRGFGPASGYVLTPIYTAQTNGTRSLTGQRIDRSYNNTFDLNFSAGLQFVSAEDSEAGNALSRILSFGAFSPGNNRVGIMLSVNQPTDGNSASLRLGPIFYFNREMNTALTYGLEAYQGDRFSSSYNFGDVIGPTQSINSAVVHKEWFTGFYLGFVYKIGK